MNHKTFCEFFEWIEENPEKIVENFTIGDYIGARDHLQQCSKCNETAQRIEEKYPEDKETGTIGFNPN